MKSVDTQYHGGRECSGERIEKKNPTQMKSLKIYIKILLDQISSWILNPTSLII